MRNKLDWAVNMCYGTVTCNEQNKYPYPQWDSCFLLGNNNAKSVWDVGSGKGRGVFNVLFAPFL